MCLWERVMTFWYHLGCIRLLLQQACENLCAKHDTGLVSVGTACLLGVLPACRTEWPLLSFMSHMPDIAACPGLETTAQILVAIPWTKEETVTCMTSREYEAEEILSKREPTPVLGMVISLLCGSEQHFLQDRIHMQLGFPSHHWRCHFLPFWRDIYLKAVSKQPTTISWVK